MKDFGNTKPKGSILTMSDGGFGTLSITTVDGTSLAIRHDSPLFEAAIEAFKAEEWEKLYGLMHPETAIQKVAVKFGKIAVADGLVTYDGEEVNNVAVQRILSFIEEGLDILPLVKFLDKLMKNPSRRSVQELYKFLEVCQLTLTENGNFLGYKAVNSDFYSITSGVAKLIKGTARQGQIYNGVGETIEIARNAVDDDANRGCSYGLHVGTLSYASSFGRRGGKLLIVEVNPADVVSVPHDCSYAKLRTAAYKVVDEFTGELTNLVYPSRYATTDDWDDDEGGWIDFNDDEDGWGDDD